jgi:hypothetical protein
MASLTLPLLSRALLNGFVEFASSLRMSGIMFASSAPTRNTNINNSNNNSNDSNSRCRAQVRFFVLPHEQHGSRRLPQGGQYC